MILSKIGFVSPLNPLLDTRLNICGVKALLSQDGMFYRDVSLEEPTNDILSTVNLLLVVDHKQFSRDEQQKLLDLASKLPLIWIGIPPEDTLPELLELLKLSHPSITVEQTKTLRQLNIHEHTMTRWLSVPEERKVKLKYLEHLLTRQVRWDDETEEVASIHLLDGLKLSSAVLAVKTTPRRVIFTFPLGQAFAICTSTHRNPRNDMDMLDYPLYTAVDNLRTLLRNAILWTRPDGVLLRKYYWAAGPWTAKIKFLPIPKGCFCMNHDLCGFSADGLEFIKETCKEHKVRTTFFDFPPFRLTKESTGGHDVALHLPDNTTTEEIIQRKNELEGIQGRKIFGWRRHGSTTEANFPQIWRNMMEAGVKWSTTFGTQTNSWLALSEATGTGNRLPFYLIDVEKGEEMNLLEFPTFDSQDAERLSNIHYGSRLSWKGLKNAVKKRLDFVQGHNLVSGYLLHGWTAGAKVEEGRNYGALDCQRMMDVILRMSKEREFTILTHQELYEWWTYRNNIKCEYSNDGAILRLPGNEYTPVVALECPDERNLRVFLNGAPVAPITWEEHPQRTLIVINPKTLGNDVELRVNFSVNCESTPPSAQFREARV